MLADISLSVQFLWSPLLAHVKCLQLNNMKNKVEYRSKLYVLNMQNHTQIQILKKKSQNPENKP